jgi:hypothetical protein
MRQNVALTNAGIQTIADQQWVARFILVLTMLLVCATASRAELSIIDDHRVVSLAWHGLPHPQAYKPPDLFYRLTVEDPSSGRFRPFHYISLYSFLLVFGSDPTLWHVGFILIGLVTVLALYRVLEVALHEQWLALFTLLLLIVTPGVSESWVRIGVAETLGFLFLALAAYLYVSIYDSLNRQYHAARAAYMAIFILITLAMLSKESFILLGPAIIFSHFIARGRFLAVTPPFVWRFRPDMFAVLLTIIVTVLLLIMTSTAVMASNMSEGSRAVQRLPMLAKSIPRVFVIYGSSMLFLLPLLFSFIFSTRSDRKSLAVLCIWAGLWTGPQLLLYAGMGGPTGRFAVPFALATSLLTTIPLSVLWRQRKARALAIVLGIALLYSGAVNLERRLSYADGFTADTLAFNDLVSSVASESQTLEINRILIVADPRADYEPAISIIQFLQPTVPPSTRFRLLPIKSSAIRWEDLGWEVDVRSAAPFAYDTGQLEELVEPGPAVAVIIRGAEALPLFEGRGWTIQPHRRGYLLPDAPVRLFGFVPVAPLTIGEGEVVWYSAVKR